LAKVETMKNSAIHHSETAECKSEVRSKRAAGWSLIEITIEYWEQLASDGDRRFPPEEWGADIKSTAAYKTLQRYMKEG